MPWTTLESRRKHYDKYYKSDRACDREKQSITLVCKICKREFHPRQNQHPTRTRYCDICRKTGVVRRAAMHEER